MPKLDPAKVSAAANAARKGDRKVAPTVETPSSTTPDPDPAGDGDEAGEGDVTSTSALSREALESALAKARKKTRRLEREAEKRGLSKDEAARVADSLAEMRGEVKRLGDALAAKGEVPATTSTTSEGAPAGATPAAPPAEPFMLTLAESLFW